MVAQSNNSGRGGFFSGLFKTLKLIGSATFGLPLALAATAAIAVTSAAVWCVNGVVSAAQRMAVKEIKDPSIIPFKYTTAFGLVGKFWDFFLFPYKQVASLFVGDGQSIESSSLAVSGSFASAKISGIGGTKTKNSSEQGYDDSDPNLYANYISESSTGHHHDGPSGGHIHHPVGESIVPDNARGDEGRS